MIACTLLIDDFNGVREGFRKSYGFSFLIEHDLTSEVDKKENKPQSSGETLRILFDCGRHPKDMMYNLQNYGLNPQDIDLVILSHNHYDHTDGISPILKNNPKIPVLLNKDWNKPHSFKGLQIPKKNRILAPGAINLFDLRSQIGQNASLIPGKKESLKNFYLTHTYYSSDYSGIYEHALIMNLKNEIVLVTGCCHPGLTKFLGDLEYFKIENSKPLQIIGGFHNFRFTAQASEEIHPKLKAIYPCHCTGNYTIYKEQFREKCHLLEVGQILRF